jgi:hypothetical protein
MNLERIETASFEDDISLAEAFARLEAVSDKLPMDENLRLPQQYWLNIAPPHELADYIVRQPNHTWHGLTIYPDEAWRYRHNDLWITWRDQQNKSIQKLNQAKKINFADWDDEWYAVLSAIQT